MTYYMNSREKNSNFFVLDLFETFCGGEICRFYNEEGVFLYRDEFSHPSVESNLLSQHILLETVKKSIESQFMNERIINTQSR